MGGRRQHIFGHQRAHPKELAEFSVNESETYTGFLFVGTLVCKQKVRVRGMRESMAEICKDVNDSFTERRALNVVRSPTPRSNFFHLQTVTAA